MSRYLYKKIQNISPESLNFQHSGLKLTTLVSDPNVIQDSLQMLWLATYLMGFPPTRLYTLCRTHGLTLMFLQLLFTQLQRYSNHLIHIIILIFSQASSKDHLFLCICHFLILHVQITVLLIINRIIRLISRFPFRGILPADDSLRKIISIFILAKLKPFMPLVA